MTNRRKIASFFGRIEHEAGRVIVLPILLTIFFAWQENPNYALYSGIVTLVLWIIYLSSHTLEKKFYGKFGPRR